MNTLVLYFILANLGLAAFYLFFRLLLQKDTFFAGKRIALLTGIILALAYPVLDFSSWIQRSDSLVTYADVLRTRLPEIPNKTAALVNTFEPTNNVISTNKVEPAVEAMPTNETATSTLTVVQPEPENSVQASIISSFTVFDYFLLLYILTTAVLLIRITRQLFRILNCRKKAERMYVHDQWVYVLKGCRSPFSFFGAVFMDPDAYSDKNQLEIIEHEKVHIRQGHSYDVVFSELVCALFWINPFTWLLKRSLRENLEFLADRDVIKKGVDPKTYQYKLLQLSCHRSDANLANHFNVSQLKKRIVMMNKKRTSWAGLGKYALSLPLFAALLLTAYAWGQQHETEAKALVAKATVDSKLIAALTVDNATDLAQNTPVKQAAEKPTGAAQSETQEPTAAIPRLNKLFILENIFKVNGIAYKKTTENTVEVAFNKNYGGDLVIPSNIEYDGVTYTVSSIGESIFYNCSALTSVFIPASVSKITGADFANCTALITVDKLNPFFTSEDGVLFDKNKTKLIHYGKKDTQYIIPSSVKRVEVYAFYNCASLTSVVIPSSVSRIEAFAFSNCSGLTSLVIPSSVTFIGESAFTGCFGLTSLVIPSSVTTIESGAFRSCQGLKSVMLSSSLTSISEGLFQSCSNLTEVTIPPSVTSIGRYAFNYCSNLTSVTLSENVSSISENVGSIALSVNAFSSCFALKQFIVVGNNPYYSSLDGVLFNKDKTKLIAFPAKNATEYVIPSSVTTIGSDAFSNSILAAVTIPSSVTTIEKKAFNACLSLKSIDLPTSLKLIEPGTFSDCQKLRTISIPASVSTIPANAFMNCYILDYKVDGNNPNYSSLDGALFNKDRTKLIFCPKYKGPLYEVPSTVTSIGEGAFQACARLTSIILPESVTAMGDGAFRQCTRLTSIVLPESLTTIGTNVFNGCTSFTSVILPSSITSIGTNAFIGCEKLSSITIPANVTSIAQSAFANCVQLKDIHCQIKQPLAMNNSLGSFANKTCTLYVPKGSKDLYANATLWNRFATIIEE